MNKLTASTLGTILRSDKARQGLMSILRLPQTRQMSYDNTNTVHNKIHDLITKSDRKVFLFMKGEPKQPQCGYSGAVIQILDAYGVEFDSCDVLEDEKLRQEIKTYSDWPTIPQLYKDGVFVGGCDILLQMHQSGELKELFKDCTKDNDK